jgi:predicted small lipoprotein YifL
MTAPHQHLARNLMLGAVLACGVMACGQRGPLELPEKVRPIQRVELPQPQPPAQPTEKQDDEQKKNGP